MLNIKGKSVSVELFRASEWPEHTSCSNEYRARINGKWYTVNGKYTFMPLTAVMSLAASLAAGEEALKEEPPPRFEKNQRVRVHYGECIDSLPVETKSGYVDAPPFRGVDGRWYVYVWSYGGSKAYPCHDVEPLKR